MKHITILAVFASIVATVVTLPVHANHCHQRDPMQLDWSGMVEELWQIPATLPNKQGRCQALAVVDRYMSLDDVGLSLCDEKTTSH